MTTPFPFVAGQVLTAAQLNSISELPTRTLTATGNAVAADRYSRVILNGSSISYTVNSATFDVGEVVHLYNINSTAATIAAGTGGVTINAAAGLTLAQYQAATLYAVSSTSFVLWKSDSPATTSGLAVVKSETSFSASSSVTADNVFSSTYTNYMMTITATTSTTATVRLRWRTSGSSNTTSNYNFTSLRVQSSGVFGGLSSGQDRIDLHEGGQTNPYSTSLMIFSPQTATRTQVTTASWNNNASATAYQTHFSAGNFAADTQFDGIEIYPSAGNMTGSYTIYGLAKS